MALLSMGQVNDRAAALLDDPGHRRFSSDYIRPHIDQQNTSLMRMFSRLGIQQEEATAIFNIPVNTTDLTPYFAVGQPLEAFQSPREVWWKITGQPDTTYQMSFPVTELDDVEPSNLGCQQYTWRGGSLQVTPSGTAVTLRIYYWALTATIFDSSAQIMRGVGDVLALLTARFICSLNNGMGTLAKQLSDDVSREKRSVNNLFVMQQQGKNIFPRGVRRTVNTQISAGGSSYT